MGERFGLKARGLCHHPCDVGINHEDNHEPQSIADALSLPSALVSARWSDNALFSLSPNSRRH
jgi:hypothetical protein